MNPTTRPPTQIAAVRRFKAARANLDAIAQPGDDTRMDYMCARYNETLDEVSALRAEVAVLRSIRARQDALEETWAALQAALSDKRADAPAERATR